MALVDSTTENLVFRVTVKTSTAATAKEESFETAKLAEDAPQYRGYELVGQQVNPTDRRVFQLLYKHDGKLN